MITFYCWLVVAVVVVDIGVFGGPGKFDFVGRSLAVVVFVASWLLLLSSAALALSVVMGKSLAGCCCR